MCNSMKRLSNRTRQKCNRTSGAFAVRCTRISRRPQHYEEEVEKEEKEEENANADMSSVSLNS